MRHRFVRPMSVEEREELARTYRASTNADLVRRCHAIVRSAESPVIPPSTPLLRVDQRVIHRWLDRCEAGGLAARAPHERRGRPPRWAETYEVALVETVRHNPRW
jgi:hypothetical protein